jgi:hypothetical protein
VSFNGERHQTSEFVRLCVCFSDFKLAQRITVRTRTVATFLTVFDSTLTALVNRKGVRGRVFLWLAPAVGTISISFIGGHLFISREKPPPIQPQDQWGQMIGKAWRTHLTSHLNMCSISFGLSRLHKLGNQEMVDFMRFLTKITFDHFFH